MSAPPTVLSQTLQSITITKIRQLKKERSAFESHKASWLTRVDGVDIPQGEKIQLLLDAVKQLDSSSTTNELLYNTTCWLEQSHYDPSIPESMLNDFEHQLRSKLDIQSRRLGLADLYSSLLTEWLRSSASSEKSVTPDATTGSRDGDFEVIERDRLQALRAKFEAVVFEPLETDEVEIDLYLAELFAGDQDSKAKNREKTVAIDRIRASVKLHGERALQMAKPFNTKNLKWCIKQLLREDLLSEQKKVILQDFLHDDVALEEIKDVLNMKHRDLMNWEWDAEDGMPVEPRQQLNGKYRIMMDEDVLQAILLQYIGITWSVTMKTTLKEAMQYTSIWKKSVVHLSQEDIDKRNYYLGSVAARREAEGGVSRERDLIYNDDFFLSQLASTVHEGGRGYDGDDDDEDEKDPNTKTGKMIKQQLLRQLATEVHLRRALDGEVAVVQSDMQWFATSLSHSTILSLLRFLGFSDVWIKFFRKFLEAPLNMEPVSENATATSPSVRIRKRGIPMAHALEKFFGELVLFVMDLAVNKESGMLLYRLHDDLWLCGKPEKCARSWKAMEQFAAVMGLEFNRKKTGSVYLTRDGDAPDPQVRNTLPTGPVAIGFLTLNPSTGTWIINQEQVVAHIKQLQKQLLACPSILSWVQTYNSCLGRFFGSTFGEPANCFGKPHVDSILETHKRLQEFLFGGKNQTGNNVVSHLKHLIEDRFKVTDVPDAFIFLPEQYGGLGVTNPFPPLLLVRHEVYTDPAARMRKFLEDEKKTYEWYKQDFEALDDSGRRQRFQDIYGKYEDRFSQRDESFDVFMSFRQFIQYRESTSSLLLEAYSDLMRQPVKKEIRLSKTVLEALDCLGGIGNVEEMDAAMKWTIQFHSAELFEKCGGLSMVDKTLLPLGVLTMLRKRRVTWQMVL